MAKRNLTEEERDRARKEFYGIVKERLDARLARGEQWTSTKDLYKGYETLHDDGFAETQFIAASVAQVLNHAEYRDRLFYARNCVTHKAERVGPGKSAPYKIYLRADATPPKDYCLVPISAKRTEIAEYVAMSKGSEDATIHVTQTHETHAETQVIAQSRSLDYRAVSVRLAEIVSKQNELLQDVLPLLDLLQPGHEVAASDPIEQVDAA